MSNWRSRKLLDSFRDAPCCCPCELAGIRKGHEHQGYDFFVAGLCNQCHSALDQGSALNREERKEFWRMAHVKTLTWLFECGKLIYGGVK